MFKSIRYTLLYILCSVVLSSGNLLHALISSNNRADPYPIFTTLDPQTYLLTHTKWRLKGWCSPDVRESSDRWDEQRQAWYKNWCDKWTGRNEWFGVSISPFGQGADKAKICCQSCTLPNSCTELCGECPCCNDTINIGDLNGRWGMFGLLFGCTPRGCLLPPTLQSAKECLFPEVPLSTPIEDILSIDPKEEIGFFSVPIKYRKKGLRFETLAQITNDVGLSLRFGVADICQQIQFCDLTGLSKCCDSTCVDAEESQGSSNCNEAKCCIKGCRTFNVCDIQEKLMCQLKNIACEIGLNLDDYHECSFEDFRVGAYWRHAYLIDQPWKCYEPFLVIPFFHLEGALAVGKERFANQPASIQFGNNGHHAVGFSSGINIDFAETIEVGGEVGATHFFERTVNCMPMPTSKCQSGIYPFLTEARVQPGMNWHFGLKMLAYHFLGCLSFHFQYVIVNHKKDCIFLNCPDPAFQPRVLENLSNWRAQYANIGFNYDISPNISLGFLWQAPLPHQGAYRSTTVMLSFNATY